MQPHPGTQVTEFQSLQQVITCTWRAEQTTHVACHDGYQQSGLVIGKKRVAMNQSQNDTQLEAQPTVICTWSLLTPRLCATPAVKSDRKGVRLPAMVA
jgi:hypothetical protein